jgi:hypothetical protein
MKVVSDLREAKRGGLPMGISKPDLDFQGYARKPIDRREQALPSLPEFMA